MYQKVYTDLNALKNIKKGKYPAKPVLSRTLSPKDANILYNQELTYYHNECNQIESDYKQKISEARNKVFDKHGITERFYEELYKVMQVSCSSNDIYIEEVELEE